MNKAKLLIGFLVITGMSMVLTNGTQLAKADIHEGTGSMLGLWQECSHCQSGGSSCIGYTPDTCACTGPSCTCSGGCEISCPWTSGRVCNYTGTVGWCDDGSVSCGTYNRAVCLDVSASPFVVICQCVTIPFSHPSCGARNTCPTPP